MNNIEGVRIGNLVYIVNGDDTRLIKKVDLNLLINWEYYTIEPITFTPEILRKLMFNEIPDGRKVNGHVYVYHLTGGDELYDYGTRFVGSGSHTWLTHGNLVVDVMNIDRYVCDSIYHLHDLQNLYKCMTDLEFNIDNLMV